jgi:aminomethyltransferase
MPHRTPLYDLHLAAGARMTPFAGWDMPLHYGSQLEEHHAVRRDAGVFDVSHMSCVDVSGPNATAMLRAALANDVARLSEPGTALYTCMLNEAGGIVDDLIVTRTGDEAYRVVCNAGCAAKDLAWIEAAAARAGSPAPRVTARRDVCLLAVQGPRAADRLVRAAGDAASPIVALAPFRAARAGRWLATRTGYTGEDGFEIALPVEEAAPLWRALLSAGVRPAGLGARDTLRLEAGLPLYGQDMDETVTPVECGLDWTVDRRVERNFVGRRALDARVPRFRRVGLVALDPGIMRAHLVVETARGPGETTSGGFSPTLQKSIGFGRVPVRVAVGDVVHVLVRDRRLTTTVTAARFVRHGKSLLQENAAP